METIICQDCGREFKNFAKLQRHIREIHMNLKPFKCEICDKEFKRKFHLTRHMVAHSDNPKPFSCTIENCSQTFSNKHHLTRHVKIVHDQERYRCQICDTLVKKKSLLQKHIREAHSTIYDEEEVNSTITPMYSEQPYFDEAPLEKKIKKDDEYCQIGMTANSTKDSDYFNGLLDFNFDDIIKAVSEINEEYAAEEEVKSETKRDAYSCPHEDCFQIFSVMGTLGSHIKACHSEPKPCKSEECDAEFCHSNSLISHSQQKHTIPSLGEDFTGLPAFAEESNNNTFEPGQSNDFQNFFDFREEDFTSFLASSPLRINLSLKPDLLDDF